MFARFAGSSSLICLLSGLALGGCQPHAATPSAAGVTPADPEPDAPMEAAAPAVAIPESFAGRWFVSAVFPARAQNPSLADPHIGVSLVIGDDEMSDVNGQLCAAPRATVGRAAGPLKFGTIELADLETLQVTCNGRAFAVYLLLPGKGLADRSAPHALLADRPEALYLLERAEQVLLRQASLPAALPVAGEVPGKPAPTQTSPANQTSPAKQTPPANSVPEPALAAPLALAPALPEPAAPEPVETVPPPVVIAAPVPASVETAGKGTTLPAPGAAIHLASYKGLSAAKRGWKVLLGDFDALDPLSPLYVAVDVAGKGEMVRLYATGSNAAGLGQACAALKAKGAYCELSR